VQVLAVHAALPETAEEAINTASAEAGLSPGQAGAQVRCAIYCISICESHYI